MNSKMHHLEVNVNKYIGYRLDKFVAENLPNISRSKIKSLIEKGLITVNEMTKDPDYKLGLNDKISINEKNEENSKLLGENIKLNIVYEDGDLLVIDKPAGLVVHPGAGNKNGTLVNALIYHCGNSLSLVGDGKRPGIVHRIDKDTSGLLVVAKNNLSHSKLGKQFSDHSIKRKYLCLVWGIVRPLKGRIETLISRNKKNRQLMMVSDFNGKKAITNYKTIQVFNGNNIPKISLIECELETGRTHQIRVHMKYKGSSLLGDQQYGKKNIKFKKINGDFFRVLSALKGQALHAKSLEFIHPSKNKWVSFESKLPDDFMKLLHLLRKHSG